MAENGMHLGSGAEGRVTKTPWQAGAVFFDQPIAQNPEPWVLIQPIQRSWIPSVDTEDRLYFQAKAERSGLISHMTRLLSDPRCSPRQTCGMVGNNSTETAPGHGKNADYLEFKNAGSQAAWEVEGVGWKLTDEVGLCFLWAVCARAQCHRGHVLGSP